MNDYVIKCGTFMDGNGGEALENVRLLVKRSRIARIETQESDLDRHPVIIDASGQTVIPGLIDSHKHIINCGGSGVGVGLDLTQVKKNIEQIYQGGVTSVLDLGSAEMLHLLPKVPLPQPRVFYALTILTCDKGYPVEYMKPEFYKMGAAADCVSKDDIKRSVKKLYKLGVSVIKTAVVSRTFNGRPQVCWTDEMLTALTDEAHSYGLNVCAHITYAADYAQAVRCGVDSVHHAAFDGIIPEQVMDEMLEKGVIFVPTISLVDLMLQGLEERWIYDPKYHPAVNDTIIANMKAFTDAYHNGSEDEPIGDLFINMPKKDFRKALEMQFKNVKLFLKLGGTVAMGTDSALGFSLHTTPIRELELLVKAGLSITKAVRASTLSSAAVFGKEHEIGSLKTGKKADILILDGDLSKDLSVLKCVKKVIIDGKLMHENP